MLSYQQRLCADAVQAVLSCSVQQCIISTQKDGKKNLGVRYIRDITPLVGCWLLVSLSSVFPSHQSRRLNETFLISRPHQVGVLTTCIDERNIKIKTHQASTLQSQSKFISFSFSVTLHLFLPLVWCNWLYKAKCHRAEKIWRQSIQLLELL